MKEALLTPQALEGVSRIFKALCEPLRLRILQELHDTEKSVSQLGAVIETSQPNLSKHLKILTDAQILRRRQAGTLVYYSISDPMVHELCETVCRGLQKQLDKQMRYYAPRSAPARKRRAS